MDSAQSAALALAVPTKPMTAGMKKLAEIRQRYSAAEADEEEAIKSA